MRGTLVLIEEQYDYNENKNVNVRKKEWMKEWMSAWEEQWPRCRSSVRHIRRISRSRTSWENSRGISRSRSRCGDSSSKSKYICRRAASRQMEGNSIIKKPNVVNNKKVLNKTTNAT